jgi:hypothetical protein
MVFGKASTARASTRNHEVQFYSDDVSFLVSLTSFIEAALRAGNAVIVVATESHRNSLIQRLPVHGVNVSSAIEQGRFIHLDTAETLSTFMESAGPNRERFLSALGPIIRNAEAAAQATPKRVVLFGEMVALLCAEGNINAAIKLEGDRDDREHGGLNDLDPLRPMVGWRYVMMALLVKLVSELDELGILSKRTATHWDTRRVFFFAR